MSNGSAALRTQFGSEVSKGSVIGILVELSEILTLTVYQNGRCLGPAFKAKRAGQAQVFPLVQAKKDGDTFRIDFKTPPKVRTREPIKTEKSVEGVWKIEQMFVGPELGEYPVSEKMKQEPVVLKVAARQDGSLQINAKVVNNMTFSASSTVDASLAPFDALTVSPGMSTLMAGPESMMDAESKLSSGLAGARKWIVSDDRLLINGPTFEIACAPFTESHDPVDTEQM